MRPKTTQPAIKIPIDYPASTIYIDESGTASDDRFFVVGALKLRHHGDTLRAIRAVRDRTGYDHEFKWTKISRGKLPAFFDLVDLLKKRHIHFAACVVDRELFDPFTMFPAKWQAHAYVTAQLLRGCINRRELVAVSMDLISTPPGVAIEDHIRTSVNNKLGNMSVVSAASLDSKTCDGLQLVDVLAGAVAFEHRLKNGLSGNTNSNKAKVLDRVRQRLEVPALDGRTSRVNIVTLQPPSGKRAKIHVLPAV